MRRFTKVASLLAAMSVLACSAAFAAYPLKDIPGDLFAPTDVFLIGKVSQDNVSKAKSYDTVVTPEVAGKPGTGFLTGMKVTLSSDPVSSSISTGGFTFNSGDVYFNPSTTSKDFHKTLIRSTFAKPVDMKFTMDYKVLDGISGDASADKVIVGLRNTTSPDLLDPKCELHCENFYFGFSHVVFNSGDVKSKPTDGAKLTWKPSKEDKTYYVECCNSFGLVATSADATEGESDYNKRRAFAKTGSRDFVVARLSEKPFVRVHVTEAKNVLEKFIDDSKVNAKSRDFRAWNTAYYNTKGHVDVPEGETYNMGVQYAISTDCTACGVVSCTNQYLPFIAVTNLGEKSVYIGDNVLSGSDVKVPDWLCNSWCGLCEFDDMMSGNKGSFGYSKTDVNSIKAQSALYDCVCHIYPAFTNTFKAAGNVDWDYKGYKTDDKGAKVASTVTSIRGRFNTAWWSESISTSTLCSSCVDNIDIYMPCGCLEQLYRDALGNNDLVFATKKTVAPESYNDVIADDAGKTADDYAVVDSVVKVKNPSADHAPNVLVTKLNWTVKASDLNGVGLVTGDKWWRADIWNKLAIRINGIKLDASNVQNVSANDLSVEELSFLTIVDGPQRNLTLTTGVKVGLFVFVVDSDDNAVKYYKTAKGNRFLVVYDGKKDAKFSYKAYVSKGAGVAPAPVSADFALSTSALELNIAVEADKAKTLSAKNTDGAVVVWTVVSDDIATISATSGDSITVTGVAVGSTTVHAAISGDANVSADCTITVKSVAPSGDSSGGGCNVGFAPALLLLLAPLAFLKK